MFLLALYFFFSCSAALPDLHSFPTRRSSDLVWQAFTEPERMKDWWGPKGFSVISWKMDFRPGGTYLYGMRAPDGRSEEHTSELQSHSDLVCRLLLEKKKKKHKNETTRGSQRM